MRNNLDEHTQLVAIANQLLDSDVGTAQRVIKAAKAAFSDIEVSAKKTRG